MLSTPTPARPMTTSRLPASMAVRVDLDLAAHDERVVVGQGRQEGSSRSRSGRTSTSCVVRRSSRPASSRAARRRGSSAPARRLARRGWHRPPAARPPGPLPDRPGDPGRCSDGLDASPAPRGCRRRSTAPRWPMRKILPVRLPWPPARTRPRAAQGAVELGPRQVVRQAGGGDRVGGVAPGRRRARSRGPAGRPGRPRRRRRGGRRSAA